MTANNWAYPTLQEISGAAAITTTQNPQLDTSNPSSATTGNWTHFTYSYLAATTRNMIVQFYLQTNDKYNWYLDDVSVPDSMLTEILTNGNFESIPALNEWITNSSRPYTSHSGISNSRFHSPNQSYYDKCDSETTLIRP